jgi:tetratricopeptide (TPR) repeat protein
MRKVKATTPTSPERRQLAWALLAGVLCSAPAAAARLQPRCEDPPRDLGLPLTVVLEAAPQGALLVVEELGLDLEVRESQGAVFESLDRGPPRLALAAFRAEPGHRFELRAREGRTGAQARIALLCEPAAAWSGLPDCTGALASGSACAAIAAQADAAQASREGRSRDALEAYQRTAEAWRAFGDPMRAAAAQFGAAQRLSTLTRFEEALESLPNFLDPTRVRAADYWNARVEGDRCLWRRRLGDADAVACQAAMPARYLALEEHSEAANAWLNLANMQVEEGHGQAARESLQQGLRSPRLTPLVRGRLGVLQARIDYEDGRIPEALRAAEQALSVLEQTTDWTWQVHALLQLGWLHHELGAAAEAERWVELAMDRLEGRETPRVLAKAELLRSRVLEALDRPREAAEAARRARAGFQDAAEPRLALLAGLRLLHLQPRATDLDELRGEFAALGEPEELLQRLTLGEAELARAAGDLKAARAALRKFRKTPSPYLELRQRALSVEVSLLRGDQDGELALQRIENEIARVQALIGAAGGAGLRHLLARRFGSLRQLWVDTYLELPGARRPPADAVWKLLLDTHAPRQLRGTPAQPPRHFEDRALMGALQLDGGERQPSAAELELLRRMLDGDPVAGPSAPGLAEAQHALTEDSVLLAWAFGAERVLLLRVESGGVGVDDIGASAPLQQSLRRIAEKVRRADTDLAELESEARFLSARLLPRMRLPQRLFTLMDTDLPHPPMALLTWPGQTQPLIDAVQLSRVDDAPPATAALPTPPRARVLFASGGDARSRPRLRNAEMEPALLARALPKTAIEPIALDHAEQLRAALAQSGAWVHIAAHGETRRGLQGYAGVWMDAGEAAPDAQFFSWLDLEVAVRSPLVVLNACALADAGDASVGGSASFAAALSAAGAKHVIAGQWELSDGAAALWVETLYAALAEHGDPARALGQAQQRLRASRSYRHPFYWAGLVHLQR